VNCFSWHLVLDRKNLFRLLVKVSLSLILNLFRIFVGGFFIVNYVKSRMEVC